MRRAAVGLLTAFALLATIGARPAGAVCNGPPGGACSATDLQSCCGDTSCTIDGTVIVSGPTCTFDFDSKNVTITASGRFQVGSATATLTVGSLTVRGELSARGASGNAGGNILVMTHGHTPVAFSMPAGSPNAIVDVSGATGGGTFSLDADGAILLDAGAVNADGLQSGGNGGTVTMTTSSGAVRIAVMSASATTGGEAGRISVTAAGDLTVSKQLASNGNAGDIELSAGGAATLALGSLLQANGLQDTFGDDGGSIEIVADSITSQGSLQAKGGAATSAGIPGGGNGAISLEARHGKVDLSRGDLNIDGAPGGDGGELFLSTDSSIPDGTLSIDVPISIQGGTGAGGGSIDANASGDLTITKRITVNGVGGASGLISLTALRDVVIGASMSGNDPFGGAEIDIDSQHDIQFNDDIFVKGTADGGGDGGTISAQADNEVTVANGKTLDASGSLAGFGGTIDLEGLGDVTIGTGTILNADGGRTPASVGGSVTLLAGAPDLSSIPTSGDLTVNGVVTARGLSSDGVAGSIVLGGCTVTVARNAVLDSTGDAGSENQVVARKLLHVDGKLAATLKNTLIHPAGGLQVTASAQISPAPGPCTCTNGSSTNDCCTRPLCTAVGTPADCLVPCTDCGDGHVDAPWETCDPGGGAPTQVACGGTPPCSLHCRALRCDDGDACSDDLCDPVGGCISVPAADGTPCDNGTVCDGRETCFLGNCQRGTPLECDDNNPCTSPDCDPINGCGRRPVPNGTSCANATRCDGDETCQDGTCQLGTPVTCPNPQDICDPASGQCGQKRCATPAECDDGNPCTEKTCNVFCQTSVKPNDTPCSNGNLCTGTGKCQGGACAIQPLNCPDDGKTCTIERCDPAAGCVTDRTPDCCDTVDDCSDGIDCTDDACTPEHVCTHVVNPLCCSIDADCDDRNPCTDDSACTNKRCTHTNVSGDRAGCGDACVPGSCQSGACVLGDPITCPSSNDVCKPNICDPVAGCVPSQQPIPDCCHDVTDCPHVDGCTDQTCTDNTCTRTPRLDCTPCARDTDCDPLGRCAGRLCAADGTCMAVQAQSCDDGDPNTRDLCVLDGTDTPQCQHQCLNSCNDSNPCTADTCSGGQCTHTPVADGTACGNDDNVCDGSPVCTAGTCAVSAPLRCDGGDRCSNASCDPVKGCVYAPMTGAQSVTCPLGVIDEALAGATSLDLNPKAKRALQKALGKVRAKLGKALGTSKKAAKLRVQVAKQLGTVGKTVRTALHKHQISQNLADTVQQRLTGAVAAVQHFSTGG